MNKSITVDQILKEEIIKLAAEVRDTEREKKDKSESNIFK